MMNKNVKFISAIAGLLLSSLVTASPLEDRTALLTKLKTTNNVDVGVYIKKQDSTSFLDAFLPISNKMTELSGNIVSFYQINSDIKIETDFLYNTGIMILDPVNSISAFKNKYKPVGYINNFYESVVVVKSTFTGKGLDSLSGRKIATKTNSIEDRVFLNTINKNLKIAFKNIEVSDSPKDFLKNDIVEAVVLSKEDAQGLIKENQGSFKVLEDLKPVPQKIIFINEKEQERNLLVFNYLTSLKKNEVNSLKIFDNIKSDQLITKMNEDDFKQIISLINK